MSWTTCPTRRGDVETYAIPDGTSLLFDPVTEAGHPLDVLRSLIWEYCDGTLSRDEIVQEMVALLPNLADIASHTDAIIEDFTLQGLLSAADDIHRVT